MEPVTNTAGAPITVNATNQPPIKQPNKYSLIGIILAYTLGVLVICRLGLHKSWIGSILWTISIPVILIIGFLVFLRLAYPKGQFIN